MTAAELRAERERERRVATARVAFELVTPFPTTGGLVPSAATLTRAVDAAVQSAMTVEIVSEVTRAAMIAYDRETGYGLPSAKGMDVALHAALTELGLRVIR